MAKKPWDDLEDANTSKGNPWDHLEDVVASSKESKISKADSFGRGITKGATLGFSDEIAGGIGYLGGKIGLVPDVGYDYYRDFARNADKESEAANPKTAMAGEFTGSIAGSMIPGLNIAKGASLATTVGKSALQGAITGAGATEKDLSSTDGLLDVAKGGALGGTAGGVGYGIGKGIEKLSKLDGKVLKEGFRKGAAKGGKVLTGVDDQNLLHYADNMGRVNQAPTSEAIKDSIDEFVGKASDRVTGSKDLAHIAKQELDDAYRATTFDLSRTRAPEGVADNLMAAMENQKSVLGDLSEKADEALVKSGATFEKSDLLSFVDNLGKSVGAGKQRALIGDEAVNAVNKLKVMRDRIEQGLGDEIDATTLRDVLRQVRKDINYNRSAGEFNDTLNGLKSGFTRNISEVLKGKSPEYAEYMKTMSDMSGNLEDMAKVFGSKEKALSALNSLGSKTGKTKDDLLKKFSELSGQEFHKDLDKFKAAKDLLEMSKRQDMRKELLPDLSNKYDDAMNAVSGAELALDPIKKLSRNSTQNAIKQQGFKTPNIENRRAFEEVGNRMNRDILGEMKDRAVLDSFDKGSTQGSRKALMYGSAGVALGGLIGGPSGAAAGGAIGTQVGGAMDIYGGKVAKSMMDNKTLQKVANTIGGVLESSPEYFGKFAVILKNAAQRGAQALVSTHYILQQSQPEYRSILQNIGDK